MGRRSTVKDLPPDVLDWIMRLREQGATYDAIVAKLRELDTLAVVPSRSALHRHIQDAERMRELVQRQVVIASAMSKDLGAEDDGKLARGNVVMAHNLVARLQMAALLAAEDGDGSIDMSPGELMQLSKALDHLGKAAKDDVARVVAIEKRAAEQARSLAAESASRAARERGLSAEDVAAISNSILEG